MAPPERGAQAERSPLLPRDARPSDRLWIDALWRQWLLEDPHPFETPTNLLVRQHWLLESVQRGALLGIALVIPEEAILLWAAQPGAPLHGYGIYVTPGARRRGLGTLLLREGLCRARRLGETRVLLSPYVTNKCTLGWLEREGFRGVQLVMQREV